MVTLGSRGLVGRALLVGRGVGWALPSSLTFGQPALEPSRTARQTLNRFLTVIDLRKADIQPNIRASTIDPSAPFGSSLTSCVSLIPSRLILRGQDMSGRWRPDYRKPSPA